MKGPAKMPINAANKWVHRQPSKIKSFFALISAMAALVLLRAIVYDHDNLFISAEAVHSIGISVLIYKLMKEKTCVGLSLKSQELMAFMLTLTTSKDDEKFSYKALEKGDEDLKMLYVMPKKII